MKRSRKTTDKKHPSPVGGNAKERLRYFEQQRGMSPEEADPAVISNEEAITSDSTKTPEPSKNSDKPAGG